MAEAPIKFGILGCANIARKLSRAIRLSPNSELYAIGSRSVERAAKFAKDNGFPDSAKVYGSYDAVLDDPEVDAVYMPLPTSLHVKWAVLAAGKKKHLLLEKPVALNVAELDLILEACESAGVQIMDATMWMHHPRTAKMEEFLFDSSRFGELKFVHSSFSFAADKNFLENDIRVKPDLDALGALGDAGWYCIRAILWAADYRLPKSVVSLGGTVLNSAGVIIACGASMEWDDGKTATFHCSFTANMTMDATVVGTNGVLRVNDFVIPYEENRASFLSAAEKPGIDENLQEWEPVPAEETVVATESPQEALMVSEFSRLVGNIKFRGASPEKRWPELSRKTQVVLDAVKASIDNSDQVIEC
ncbi:uncharacterized oxidoreductase At4g09670-like [Andrographis paniculata]|uniref:uncharacterized oxidoreductase At4g09670-like n=1 Tax=Andrographis paniculata TaxID=175694 RepID=UPI0021E9A89F|nr:uncharacterized oxidoreductase At4g09670-like [Andrographis paniculata]